MDGPLAAVRAPRSGEIAEQVEMDAREDQDAEKPPASRDPRGEREPEREGEVVGHEVVILGPPVGRRPGRARREIDEDSQAVEIRGQSGADDPALLPAGEARHRGRQRPADEGMRDDIHRGGGLRRIIPQVAGRGPPAGTAGTARTGITDPDPCPLCPCRPLCPCSWRSTPSASRPVGRAGVPRRPASRR